jgi:hypothetical protein
VPGNYQVILAATDDDGGVVTDVRQLAVTNLAPVIAPLGAGTAVMGTPFVRNGQFSDATGPEDGWSATVRFGGGPLQPLLLNADKTFALQHAFSSTGPQLVTVTVTDRFGGQNSGSFLVDVSPDGTTPGVTGFGVNDGGVQRSRIDRVTAVFRDEVGASLSIQDFRLENLTLGTVVSTASMMLSYNAATRAAVITFPGLPGGALPNDGNYRLTVLAAGIVQLGGPLERDFIYDFYVLRGDANGDRVTNDLDLLQVWQSLGGSPAFDLTGDNLVTNADLDVIRNNYRATLPALW